MKRKEIKNYGNRPRFLPPDPKKSPQKTLLQKLRAALEKVTNKETGKIKLGPVEVKEFFHAYMLTSFNDQPKLFFQEVEHNKALHTIASHPAFRREWIEHLQTIDSTKNYWVVCEANTKPTAFDLVQQLYNSEGQEKENSTFSP